MSKPTKEDAALIIQLMTALNTPANNKAGKWLNTEFDVKNYDTFKAKYPKGSEGYSNFMKVASNWELLTTFVNRDLLSEDLVFDLWGPLFWKKFEPIVLGMRKEMEMPRLFENYEVCAKRYPQWAEQNPPKV
ncbi:hypothetical protein DSAG12_02679 [Promethearchaeum syntrophicum]|uniref:Uncharacterized protein n=1 Tax=Promethearchaeum syntrophicum TaxID=2594042 RepID=A0A5B9DC31_9ARCH|nr:hypothetical protein [Candidatus Prometheoarchaeum syntrophicum]QEE16849.1 hypothetical protein DSAG12_02679 [Candidatus Prometheoarchaeum syntrophicum]